MMVNILLCGGSGSRLWPVSREAYPKQFCKFTGKFTLFQESLLRNKDICDKTVIVTNVQHYELAKTQIEEIKLENVQFVLEPIGRNTAPAITLACLELNSDDIALVTPSDHYIDGEEEYREAINNANMFAEADYLVTFGVKPSYPETGFGYIKAINENVISFIEKPDKKKAEEYLESGEYYWNSGMFVFKVKSYLEEINSYSGEIYLASQEAYNNKETDKNIVKILKPYMEKIPATSIDYAVMEKSKKIKMVTLKAIWSDLGSFEAIYGILSHDANNNVSTTKNIFFNSGHNLIISDNKLVALIDVDDLIVINTGDAILISKRGSSYKIKELIYELENIFPDITKTHI